MSQKEFEAMIRNEFEANARLVNSGKIGK